MGLYVGFVFVASQFIRSNLFADKMVMIMFYELPQVDWILQLLLDIYLVREMSSIVPVKEDEEVEEDEERVEEDEEFEEDEEVEEDEAKKISRERLELEEFLFAQLLCLYRSPHILFKMTRHKQQAQELE